MANPLVAFLDPRSFGHHPMYTRVIVERLLKAGARVGCGCADPGDMAAWVKKRLGAKMVERLVLKRMDWALPRWSLPGKWGYVPAMLHRVRLWKEAANTVRMIEAEAHSKVDHVFFGMIDDYLTGGLPPGYPDTVFPFNWSGILMFPPRNSPNGYPRMQRWALKTIQHSRYCRNLFVLVESVVNELGAATNKPVHAFPDFCPETQPGNSTIADRIKAQANGRSIIGLFGIIDNRKGIHELLETARQAGDRPWFFAVVGSGGYAQGRMEAEIFSEAVHQANLSNLCFIDTAIPCSEFDALIDTCDLIWAAYKDFPNSSNVITRASFRKKPVIVTAGGLLANRVRRFENGVVVPELTPKPIIEGIEAALDNMFSDGCGRYHEEHSLAKLDRVLNESFPEIK